MNKIESPLDPEDSPCEDYRIKGRDRLRTMTLDAAELSAAFSCTLAAQRLPPHSPLRPICRERFEPATSSASDNGSPRLRASPAETDCDFEGP